MKKRMISILLSAAMISSMVVAGGVTAHAEENVTLTVFDAHAYGLDEYDEMVKAFEEAHPGVTIDVQHAPNDIIGLFSDTPKGAQAFIIMSARVSSRSGQCR